MPRLIFPLSLSASAAFAAAWCASASFSAKTLPDSSMDGSSGLSASSGSPPPDSGLRAVAGFARREAMLQATEITDIPSIRRLLETSPPDGGDLVRLVETWVEEDPAGLWQWMENGGRSKLRPVDLTNTDFQKWFLKDPDAALAAFRAADPDRRESAANGMLSLLLTPDASMRTKLLAHLDEIVKSCLGNPFWGSENGEMVTLLSTLPQGTGRDRLLENTSQNWVPTDWKAATTWATGLAEPMKSQVLESMARDTLRRNSLTYPSGEDPKSDASQVESFSWFRKWLTSDATREQRSELGGLFVKALAKQDPEAALNWAQENLTSRTLTKSISDVLAQKAAKDPGAARTLVESLPPGGLRQRAAFGVISKPDAESVTWLLAQADRKDARPWGELAVKWAFENPDAYKKFVAEAAPDSLPPSLREDGLDNLIHKDAPATMTWAMETGGADSAGKALDTWGRQDSPTAAKWLKENMSDQWGNSDTSYLAGNYFDRSPEDAVNWALSLPDSPARQSAIRTMTGSLSYAQSLSAELRSSLTARLGGNP